MRSTHAHVTRFLAVVVLAAGRVGPNATGPGDSVAPSARAFPLRFERTDGGALVADVIGGSIAVEGDTILLDETRIAMSGARFEGDDLSPTPTRDVTVG